MRVDIERVFTKNLFSTPSYDRKKQLYFEKSSFLDYKFIITSKRLCP